MRTAHVKGHHRNTTRVILSLIEINEGLSPANLTIEKFGPVLQFQAFFINLEKQKFSINFLLLHFFPKRPYMEYD